MGKEDGLVVLDKIKEEYPALPVLMISGHATIETAVQATKKGAVDFLEKPLSLDGILEKISDILQAGDKKNGKGKEKQIKLEFDEIIGQSEEILLVKRSIAQAAGTNARVFIFGENGTGKELVARAIFQNSRRREEPFVEVNCAAIPEELIESELFGHEKGAFTGATEKRIGKFEQADGGTLFLDEICDMSLSTQARVLRVLQEQRFHRVGGTENIEVDVRIIAATNIPPQEAIKEGRFREDLYYRLNVIPIDMPPLRERQNDIPHLMDHFLRETSRENGIALKKFAEQALSLLLGYDWPGNVRELKNVVERLSIMSEEDEITDEVVRQHLKDETRPGGPVPLAGDLKKAREEFERNYIIEALKQHENNVSKAARFLGLERTNLHRKIKSLGIELERIKE
jgi:DNA-binding NtrC family response regulator